MILSSLMVVSAILIWSELQKAAMITNLVNLSSPRKQFCGICGQYTMLTKYDSDMQAHVCDMCLGPVLRAEVNLRDSGLDVPSAQLIKENP